MRGQAAIILSTPGDKEKSLPNSAAGIKGSINRSKARRDSLKKSEEGNKRVTRSKS